MNKITTIRDDLVSCTRYQPQNSDEVTKEEFKHVNDQDVKRILSTMQNKHCEKDAVSTIIIKVIFDEILLIIIHIVSTSLIIGQFSVNWKTAIESPYLKNQGLT